MSQDLTELLWIIAGIIFFIVYFGLGPYERRRLRIKQGKPPDDLAKILNGLPEGWQLIAYRWHGSDWSAELGLAERHFRVMSDYGYPGPLHLVEIGGKEPSILSSPLDHRWHSGGPDEIRQQLAELVPDNEN